MLELELELKNKVHFHVVSDCCAHPLELDMHVL